MPFQCTLLKNVLQGNMFLKIIEQLAWNAKHDGHQTQDTSRRSFFPFYPFVVSAANSRQGKTGCLEPMASSYVVIAAPACLCKRIRVCRPFTGYYQQGIRPTDYVSVK